MSRILSLLACLLLGLGSATAQPAATWWGYWHSDMPLTPAGGLPDGYHHFGLRLTSANSQLSGSLLHGMRFYLTDKTAVKRAWVWLSMRSFQMPGAEADRLMVEVPVAQLRDMNHDGQPTEFLLDEPVELLGTGRYANVYAGFVLQLEGASAAPCQVMASGSQSGLSDMSYFFNWEDLHDARGALALQLLVSGQNIAAQGLNVALPVLPPLLAGSQQSTAITLTNDGIAAVENIDCLLTLDGVQQSLHYDLPQPIDELGLDFTLPLELAVPSAPALHRWQVEVTHVNGLPNEGAAPLAADTLTALSQLPLKRAVMEELTGTWCPNCPRGLVGIQLLEEIFADRFVAIAIHGGDSNEPMLLPEYDGSDYVRGLSRRMGGRPSCAVDRTIECDPYGGVGGVRHFGADQVVSLLLSQTTVADLDVSAQWATETSIDVDVATTFRYASPTGCPYRLMLVLTADSLTGEGDEWLQVNTLVGKTDYDADLDEFVYGERRMALKYNHVPVWVDGVDGGIAGSVSLPLTADVAQHYQRTVDMTGNVLVQRPDLLHAVALLIDTRTGQVANTARCHVDGAATEGITGASVAPAVDYGTMRFAPDGRPATARTAGLLLERRTDGTVHKVIGR